MNDLIARLEKATGPDRALEADIAAACAPTDDPREAAFLNGRDYPDLYTSSIDAALTLVPEGWTRSVDATAPEMGIDVDLFPKTGYVRGSHLIEAIATCIAALKARAVSSDNRDPE
jgi:hypothetical protein